MQRKASVLTLRVPFELKHRLEQVADEQGVSLNQFALYSFAKEINNMKTHTYLANVWKSKSKKQLFNNFHDVLQKVKSKPSPAWDRMD